jgi:23S rRNA pseudouridine1911/1915/1917 synthase
MKDADLQALRGFRRQALHAKRLGLIHPGSGEDISWEAPIPDDFTELLSMIEAYT